MIFRTRRSVAGHGGDPSERTVAEDVDTELARRAFLELRFSPPLEALYEAETKAERTWNIRLTLGMGLISYNVFTLVDGTILPDLGWVPSAWRLGIITPVALIAMWQCDRIDARLREAYLTLMMLGAMIGPVVFMLVSRAPLATYTMLIAILVSMFGTITIRLRFQWAGLFTLLTLIWVGGMVCLKPDLPLGLSVHSFLATVVCVSFGLVANNQLERGERRGFLLTLRETSRSEQLSVDKATLAVLSQVDALTGLANRRTFDAKLDELWQRHEKHGETFSLLMIDVDFFKRFNDFYGHPSGDACLQRVGGLLRDVVMREQDLVARYGGEEFSVLLRGCKLKNACDIAERIRLMISDAAIVHGNRDDDTIVSVSIGVAASDTMDFRSSAELLSVADHNLYEAKRAGRNRFFPPCETRETLSSAA